MDLGGLAVVVTQSANEQSLAPHREGTPCPLPAIFFMLHNYELLGQCVGSSPLSGYEHTYGGIKVGSRRQL
jgi:hypothetical protein